MAYSDQVLDHYENPRNVGSLDKASVLAEDAIKSAIEDYKKKQQNLT